MDVCLDVCVCRKFSPIVATKRAHAPRKWARAAPRAVVAYKDIMCVLVCVESWAQVLLQNMCMLHVNGQELQQEQW